MTTIKNGWRSLGGRKGKLDEKEQEEKGKGE